MDAEEQPRAYTREVYFLDGSSLNLCFFTARDILIERKNFMKFFYLFLLCLWMTSTACSKFPQKRSEPSQKEPLKLTIINYNLWFGLGDGLFEREELEPMEYRQDRQQHQLNLLEEVEPDILFIQEVNPVDTRTKEIAHRLNMNYVLQRTNCGVSVLDFGFPVNLDMGIAILVRPTFAN